MIDLEKDSNREAFESWATDKFPIAGLGQFEKHNNGTYLQRSIRNMYEAWQAAKAQAVPEGFVLVRKEPNEDQWGGFARLLGRYMQSHSRYCPSNLKKYIEHFESIPDWLNREVTNWESDHAFATADLPVFIYKAMIEAQEPTND